MFPHRADTLFGGCSCLLFGDFGQLPPVMDLPLYTTVSRSPLSDAGSAAYQLFDRAIVLKQVMRQSGQDPDQVLFRDILLRLRDARLTISDWEQLMKQTPAEMADLAPFTNALHLHPTIEAVVEHNISKLRASGHPVATIKAVHSGQNASKASSEDAGGLESIICLACNARVMLTSNLWVDMGLVNGAMGTVVAICYRNGESPPNLPIAVTVRFDSYRGPTLSDGTVPITPLRRTWSASGGSCSRLQLPPQASLGCHHPQSSRANIEQSGDRRRQEGILCRANIRCLLACSSYERPSFRSSLSLPKGSQPGQQPTSARKAPTRYKAAPP